MVETISRDELTEKVARHDKFRLVDVLPEEQYHLAHLPGAINMPSGQVSTLAPKRLKDRDADIVVYGGNAEDAGQAVRELADMGYTHVREYAEGKQDWVDTGLPMVSDLPRESHS